MLLYVLLTRYFILLDLLDANAINREPFSIEEKIPRYEQWVSLKGCKKISQYSLFFHSIFETISIKGSKGDYNRIAG